MMASITSDGFPDLANMLPAEVRGWKPEGPDGVYNAETLYGYINGAAEVYRSLNVRAVLARRYVKDGAPEIIVDVFDMGSFKDAFGAYHHDMREGPEVDIGRGSEFMDGSLSFWKGCYFVSIMPFDETEDVKLAVLDLGKTIAGSIVDPGAEPDLVKLLPQKGRLTHQIHYFHDHLLLNIYYFLAEENLLHLDRETEGILARYKPESPKAASVDSSSFVVLLIRYPSPAKAQKAYKSFLKGYLPDADVEGMVQTENSKWSGVQLKGNLIIGVFDARSKAEILELTEKVEKRHKSRDS